MARPEIFIDTAKVDEIISWNQRLPIEGVTTNQLIMAKEGIPADQIKDTIVGICRALPGKPVSVELLDSERANPELIEEAVEYASLNPYIVVKVPTIADGRHLEIIADLVRKGVKVNSTLNVTCEQMLVAALAGASYVSLFFNRARDAGEDPNRHIERMANMIVRRDFDTKIIVGSIRKPEDVSEAITSGGHIVTITPKVLAASLFHPKSEETRQEFDKEGRKFSAIVNGQR